MQHQKWFTGSLRLSLRVDTGTYIYVTITDGYQTPAGVEAHTSLLENRVLTVSHCKMR